MSFNDDKEMRRYIILDHYENPKYFIKSLKGLDKSYKSFNNNSPSCIDNITAYVKLKGDKVADVKLYGEGCAIATSSSDIMASMVKNKTVSEANKLIDNYLNMIDAKKYNDKSLKELTVFSNVNQQINRVNCAKVGIVAIKNAINEK